MRSLEKNKRYIDSCIKTAETLYDRGYINECVSYIEKILTYAWLNFSGYYKLQRIEDILIKIGRNIPEFENNKIKIKETNKRKILHICSEIYNTGGHTKLLFNWIETDKETEHTLLSTRMPLENLKNVTENYTSEKINLLSAKGKNHVDKAFYIKNVLYHNYDFIILHVHPNEVLIILSLSDERIMTPVLFLNHADHTFWLGGSIIDVLLQIREVNIIPDQKKRGIDFNRQKFLPIPVQIEKSKSSLIKKTDYLYILTTGSEYKYTPNENYNFYKEMTEIVTRFPDVIVNIAGVRPESKYAKEYSHSRINFLGSVSPSQLKEYEDITDIYLEGFPVPSFTALLQVGVKGIPFLLHYNPVLIFKLFKDKKENFIIYPKNKDEWYEILYKLLQDASYRKKTALNQQKYLNENYSIDNWGVRLNQIYAESENIKHHIFNTGEDTFFHTEEENILLEMNKIKIDHYLHTNKLNMTDKFKLILRSMYNRPKVVKYYRGLRLIKYFLNH